MAAYFIIYVSHPTHSWPMLSVGYIFIQSFNFNNNKKQDQLLPILTRCTKVRQVSRFNIPAPQLHASSFYHRQTRNYYYDNIVLKDATYS
jgi:hypothetical protein